MSRSDDAEIPAEVKAEINAQNKAWAEAVYLAQENCGLGIFDTDYTLEELYKKYDVVLGEDVLPTGITLSQIPEDTFTVERMIPDGGVTLFVGKPESGKSLLMNFLADRVIRGKPFLGRETTRRPVLYVDMEGTGLGEMKRRRDTFDLYRGLRGLDAMFWSISDKNLGPPPADPEDPSYARILKKRHALAIFDSLSFFSEGKIIEPGDIAPVLIKFKSLAAKLQLPVIVLHHSSDKDDKNTYLGSTLIRAVIDAGYFVEAKEDINNRHIRYVELSSLKGRRGTAANLSIKVDWEEGTYEREAYAPKERVLEKYRELIKKHPGISQRDAAKKLHVDRQIIRTLQKKYRSART